MSPKKIRIISYVLIGYGVFGLIGIISNLSIFYTTDDLENDWTKPDREYTTLFGKIISILYAIGPLIPGLWLLRKYRKLKANTTKS